MSRENFVLKLSTSDTGTPLLVNPSHIATLEPNIPKDSKDAKGTILTMSNGKTYIVAESFDNIEQKGKEHGVFRYTGN